MATKFTEGPWEYVAGTAHHGPYVAAGFYGDVCDCYTMSDPSAPSIRNGGHSRPIWFHGERADANARLIAAAPTMYAQIEAQVTDLELLLKAIQAGDPTKELEQRVHMLIEHSRAGIKGAA